MTVNVIWTTFTLGKELPLEKVSCKSTDNFLHDRQTYRMTDRQTCTHNLCIGGGNDTRNWKQHITGCKQQQRDSDLRRRRRQTAGWCAASNSWYCLQHCVLAPTHRTNSTRCLPVTNKSVPPE